METGPSREPGETEGYDPASSGAVPLSEELPEPDPSGETKENPEAERKEFDENASAEIVAGVDRTLHGEGEGAGAFADGRPDAASVSKLNDEADETAKLTVPAEKSDRMGVDENAEEADSAMTYYTVLLRDRLDSLYECKRLNVYWETKEDHVTVFKTSPEHELILAAGAYDVSARLLAENLSVDDGWIGRKNPEVIVKVVDSRTLGSGVSSDAGARAVYRSLLNRPGWKDINAIRNGRILLLSEELLNAPYLQTAAALMIAKTAYPDFFADTSLEEALQKLTEEAASTVTTGVYYYFNGE